MPVEFWQRVFRFLATRGSPRLRGALLLKLYFLRIISLLLFSNMIVFEKFINYKKTNFRVLYIKWRKPYKVEIYTMWKYNYNK